MADDPKGPGGSDNNSGGGVDDPKNDAPKTYSQEFVDKLMKEKKSASERLKISDAEKLELENYKKQAEDEKLAAEGAKDKQIEERDKEIAELREKAQARDKRDQDARKLNSVLEALDGNLDSQYWGLVDIDKISLDVDGKPDADSVKEYANQFSTDFSKVLSDPEPNPRGPNGAPKRSKGEKMSVKEWRLLPLKEMKLAQKEKRVDFENTN